MRKLFSCHENAILHLSSVFLVVGAGFFFRVTTTEWVLLLICIAIVLLAEGLNSAIEYLGDRITPDYSELIRDAKDIAAGAVLIAALIAAICGVMIFYPYLRMLF